MNETPFEMKESYISIFGALLWFGVQNALFTWMFSWLYDLNAWECLASVIHQTLALAVLLPILSWNFGVFSARLACTVYSLVSFGCIFATVSQNVILPDSLTQSTDRLVEVFVIKFLEAWWNVLIVFFACSVSVICRIATSRRSLVWCLALSGVFYVHNVQSTVHFNVLYHDSVKPDQHGSQVLLTGNYDQFRDDDMSTNPYKPLTVESTSDRRTTWLIRLNTFSLYLWTDFVYAFAVVMGIPFLILGIDRNAWPYHIVCLCVPLLTLWGYRTTTLLPNMYMSLILGGIIIAAGWHISRQSLIPKIRSIQ